MLSARQSAQNCTDGLTCSAYIDAHPASRLSSPDFTRPSIGRRSQASRFHHGSSMGRIPLRFGHTSPGPSLWPPVQMNADQTCLWVAAGILSSHESITQVPQGLEGGLESVRARETQLSPARYCLGRAVRKGSQTRFASINSTLCRVFGQRHLRVQVGLKPRAPPLGRCLCQLSYQNPRLSI